MCSRGRITRYGDRMPAMGGEIHATPICRSGTRKIRILALCFSGAKMSQRDTILKAMVDSLLRGGNVSHVATVMDGNDVTDGVRRKVGFVVKFV